MLFLYRHRYLLGQLVRREVVGRYRGSVLGLAWSFLNPLLLLTAYTFVFGLVFKSSWNVGEKGNMAEFALIVFCGMIPFNLVSETLARAPSLMPANASYVKKVVFPLEILPLSIMGAALVHALISMLILIAGVAIVTGKLSPMMLLYPVVLLPALLLTAGLSWFLASLGVFLRDLQQLVALLLQLLMFLSPIFYPASRLPAALRTVAQLNPMTQVLENGRSVVVFQQMPDWMSWGVWMALGGVVALAGLTWFNKTRHAFADVL
ncbi:MAG: ABC transporter permease [Burkholderiales bacterium]|nr:ABC transporter permease [Burkholderiales bacterium]